MPKFITLTETDHGADQPFTRPTWINTNLLTRFYEGIEDAGSFVEMLNEPGEALAVTETPTEIMALIEGRPLPKAPVEGGAAAKIVLAPKR